ncbi:phosphodiester glycosidase family protein [Streptomyces sp. DSM 44915]|uniref:Phosphodiester glycosidase family protein n=1 Tax=Streptomyces chisholmiae TaxID=3075540 RepID=A0ABU2JLF5_9ACTN|nr:phosphodiester glycosidase family protein [Streptomyces sp. DSM 44915]
MREALRAPSLIAAGAALALTGGLVPPAHAAPSPTSATAVASAIPTGVVEGDGLELSRTEQPLAPGAELTSFHRLESDKWLSAHALSLDLTADLRVDYLAPEQVADAAPVSELVAGHDPGAGRTTVAAINADFFDINATDAPLGPGISEGELVHGTSGGASQAVGISADGAGRILDLYFDGTATLPNGEIGLAGYNSPDLPPGGIGVFTPRWGEADRGLPVVDAEETTEVVVSDGEVTSVSEKPGSGPIPEGATVLLGREAGARALEELAAGDPVSLEYAPRTDDGSELPRTAVGGRGLLVVDGEPQNWEGLPNNATAPRTAVGFSRDGQQMYVLSVEGRQAHSGGTTLTELAVLMADLGAHSALNLDGGGSSTLLARLPGGAAPELVNRPSDGAERPVPNGLAITAPVGSGELSGLRVGTTADPELAPTSDAVPGGHPERVFPGLTRQLTAIGHDERFGPAAASPRWHTDRPRVGTVRDGVFLARSPGTTEVTARERGARGGTELTVLGELTTLSTTTRRLGLAEPGDTGTFGVLGTDAAGTSAPIEPADAELTYDASLFTIEPDAAGGRFTVTAGAGGSASGLVTVTVGGLSTVLAVTVGLDDTTVADFSDAAEWTFAHARADGSVAPEPAGREGEGLRLAYDFSLSTATRAAYVYPPAPRPVPGQPARFTLWVNGDGHGAWPSLQLRDARGTDLVLRAEHLDFEGWRQLVFEVPQGTAYPVSVHRLYLAETRPDQSYTSEVVLDELRALTPPEVELPAPPASHQPLIDSAAGTDGRDWRFAVVSDAQFVARAPESELVQSARRSLREARAADPDFVLINGDLVDEGAPEDLAFARTVIEEELGDELPWYYVPGNHEVMGGSIDGFRAEFGATQLTFDHRGTRFVTLDTSALTLRGGGFAQIRELRAQLDAAAEDRSIDSVVVVGHVPPRDTMAQPASQLTDRWEAALLERWLTDFRQRSGKGVAYFGAHVGVFDTYRLDGVPYVIGGNAGKEPATVPEEGGFNGWLLVGVDGVSRGAQREVQRSPERPGPDWLSVRTMARVDGLELRAPASLTVGEAATAGAVVTQDGAGEAREVPVGPLVSADWSGSRGLHLGPADEAGHRAVAAFDPATGELTGLRPGEATLEVTVNGESRRATVAVARR